MRPRHKTAENSSYPDLRTFNQLASMRPRHKTAENRKIQLRQPGSGEASMRPRHKTAENKGTMANGFRWWVSFNEAAA